MPAAPDPIKPVDIATYASDLARFKQWAMPMPPLGAEKLDARWQAFQLWRIAEALEALVDVEGARGVDDVEPPEPWQGDPWDIKVADDDDTDDEL